MNIYLLRHGRTAYNDAHRYQGRLDIPLSPAGEAALAPAPFAPDLLVVSPLVRARQTAELLFPGVPQTVLPGLMEMDFGAFEGRTYQEMEADQDYRAWVDGGCEGRCPGGEDLNGFRDRTCSAFAEAVELALAHRCQTLAVVAHGGVQMAVMERFALPRRSYFQWNAPCGGGFLLALDPAVWARQRQLTLLETVSWGKDGKPC